MFLNLIRWKGIEVFWNILKSLSVSFSKMFEFGDELIIDSYRIPWLIWIQLLAMFLLVILLYYFTSTPSDLSIHFSTVTATASPSSAVNRSFLTSSTATTLHNLKVRENEIRETGTSTSGLVQRARKPDVEQRERSNVSSGMMFEQSHHPCHFFGLAKQAFLKCLGIDSSPECSIKRPHEKDD